MKKIGKTIPRRRKQGKTDYKLRLALLKSSKPRLVVRKSNRFIFVQIVESSLAQDKIICSASSKELLDKGWPKELQGSLKSLPAAYLTGRLIASKAKKVQEVILDIGLQRSVAGGRVYAVLKGAIDGGLKIPHSKEALPNEKMLGKIQKTKVLIDKIGATIK